MSWFLFIDESGHDHGASPYEVLAGVAIQDRAVREVIAQLHEAEIRCFGRRYSDGRRELKGKVLLKKKVFRHRVLNVEVDAVEISTLARAALDDGARADARMLKALGMAKLNYVASVFEICAQLDCRAFASIVETDAHPTAGDGLRKDYAYLFERFFYFLEDNAATEQGIVVFDELEKSKSHLLIDQMHRYFVDTAVGRHRANRIIPSHHPRALLRAQRPHHGRADRRSCRLRDLLGLSNSPDDQACTRGVVASREPGCPPALPGHARERLGNPEFDIWSFAHITDLRTQAERDEGPS